MKYNIIVAVVLCGCISNPVFAAKVPTNQELYQMVLELKSQQAKLIGEVQAAKTEAAQAKQERDIAVHELATSRQALTPSAGVETVDQVSTNTGKYVLNNEPLAASFWDKINVSLDVGLGRKTATHINRKDQTANYRFNMVTANLNTSYDKYFLSIGTELPIGNDTDNQGGSAKFAATEQHSFTLGYSLFEKASVFGGYLYSKYTTSSGRTTFIDKGPFIGASYNFFTNDNYSLTGSAAFAVLDATIEADPDLSDGSTHGETTGASYGLTFRGPFNDRLGYFISLKINDYEFKDDNIPNGGRSDTVKRDSMMLSTGLTFY